VNGVRSKTTKSKIALYQPLTLLDLVVYFRENANIKRIKEVKCIHPYQNIHADVKKSVLAMFINEVLNKTVKEESHANDLCEFLIESFITLDELQQNVENFHLIFLLKLSRFLGFGVHQVDEVLAGRVVDKETEKILDMLIYSEYETLTPMTNAQRREILDLILKFYRDHIETLGEMKSVQVLREVLM
jgi:DNA repair protein RecO (recombination protein O)